MKKLFSLILGLVLLINLTSCGEKKERLYILNWGEYMDPEIVAKFEKEYNVDVIYEETNSNEAMYTKIAIGTSAYDIAIPSEYMIEKMIKDKLVLEIDSSKFNNKDNIDTSFYDLMSVENSNKYFVPYFTGSVGIIYNTDLVDESMLNGWDTLWDKQFKDKIYMYDSVRDLLMVGAFKNGYDINTTDLDELKVIEDDLKKQGKLTRGYATDDIKALVSSGDGALGVVYNGDYIATYFDAKDNGYDFKLGYYIPEEGTNLWVDGFVIPKTSKNTEMAHKFIDFMLEYDNAYQNTTYVGYPTTNIEVKEALVKEDPDFYNSQAYRMTGKNLANAKLYQDLGKDYYQIYNKIFIKIKND